MKTWYFIPARRDTKGFKFKNRKLLPITVGQIPHNEHDKIIVSTNDEYLIDFCKKRNILLRVRPEELASDEASMKDVIKDATSYFKLDPNDKLVVLYPTYPQRTFEDIQDTLKFFNDCNLKSCTGRSRLRSHPYLSFKKTYEIFAEKIVDHSLYRRQDYPECFGLCHIVYITLVSEVDQLDDLLLNRDTGFRWVDDVIDVDSEDDFLEYAHNNMSSGIERFNPRVFEIEFSPFMRHFERYFQSVKLLGRTGRNESWLDCACGSGYGTMFLTNFANRVWGYDIDKNAIAHARHHYKNSYCGFVSDISTFEKQKFNAIFSIETIEHMPREDAPQFLKTCFDMLDDNGDLIITTPIIPISNPNPINEFHFFEYSIEDFISLLNDAGFKVINHKLIETTFTDGETKDQGYFKCQKF